MPPRALLVLEITNRMTSFN